MVVMPTPGFTLHLAVGAALSRRTVANGILVKGGARFIAATLPLLFLRRADAADSADSSDRAESWRGDTSEELQETLPGDWPAEGFRQTVKLPIVHGFSPALPTDTLLRDDPSVAGFVQVVANI
jgi:hypothetical protein